MHMRYDMEKKKPDSNMHQEVKKKNSKNANLDLHENNFHTVVKQCIIHTILLYAAKHT